MNVKNKTKRNKQENLLLIECNTERQNKKKKK